MTVSVVASDRDAAEDVDAVLPIPDVGFLEPLLANVALQLFAYHVADAKGRPIDKPRNLAKSVTVEEVVGRFPTPQIAARRPAEYAIFDACHLVRPLNLSEYALSEAVDLLIHSGRTIDAIRLDGWRIDVGYPEDRDEAERRIREELEAIEKVD